MKLTRTNIKATAALITILLLLVASSVLSSQTLASSPSQRSYRELKASKNRQKAKIDFASPVSLEEVMDIARHQRLRIVELHHAFSIGDNDFVGFYPVPAQMEPDQIRSGILEAHQSFLRDMVESTGRTASEEDGYPNNQVTDQNVNTHFKEALSNISFAEPQISEALIQGKIADIEGIKDLSPSVERIEVIPENEEPYLLYKAPNASTELNEQSIGPTIMATVNPGTWVPSQGNVLTGQSSPLYRYVNVAMLWNNVSGFDANSTFEPDFFLNNNRTTSVGPGTYLDRSQNILGMPIVYYAASSLPRAYLDTRLTDPTTEVAYTIGSSKASDIRTNQWYYNYIQVLKGDADRDNAKLSAQLGYRSPSGCYYSTWCSYRREDVPLVRIFNAWDIPVPGFKSWRR